MAVEFEVEAARNTEYGYFPEELEVIPEMNGRHELPDITSIIDSILRMGQIQPVIIRRSGGKPVLVAGFSRWRAVSEINLRGLLEKPIRLRCSYTALTEKQAFLANIEENRARNATTPVDDAYNIQRLINIHQMTEQEVADAYRSTVAWIRGRMGLIELTPEAEKAVREGRVADSAVKQIAKLSRDLQKQVVKKEGKITSKDVREAKPYKKPPVKDRELTKLVRIMLEDIVAGMIEDPKVEYIEVERTLVLNLANYVK